MKRNHILAAVAALTVLIVFSCLWGVSANAEMQGLTCEITLDKTAVEVGQPIKASWTITGGKAPYEAYALWYLEGAEGTWEPDGYEVTIELKANGGYHVYKATHGTKGRFRLGLKDADGLTGDFWSSEFAITGSPEPVTAAITLDKESVDVGQPVKASWTVTGGKGPFKVSGAWFTSVADTEPSTMTNAEIINNSSMFTPKSGTTGYFHLRVINADGWSIWFKSSSFEITGGLKVDITLDKTTVGVGQPIKATWTITGGMTPYTNISWAWVILEADSDEENWFWGDDTLDSSTLVPKVGVSGYFQLYVQCADEYDGTTFESPVFTITGAPEPIGGVIILDKTTVEVGQPIKATWTVSGGLAPYEVSSYGWMIKEADGIAYYNYGEVAKTATEGSFIPPYGVSGYLGVEVRDAAGNYSNFFKSSEFTITGSAGPLTCEINLDKGQVVRGQTITANWLVEGWNEPLRVEYVWRVEDADGFFYDHGNTDAEGKTTSSFLVDAGGRWGYLQINIYDSYDNWKQFEKSFSIIDEPDMSGDANGDEAVDILDLVSIIDYIVSGTDTTSMPNADANGDGTVDIMDLVWIIDVIVGG